VARRASCKQSRHDQSVDGKNRLIGAIIGKWMDKACSYCLQSLERVDEDQGIQPTANDRQHHQALSEKGYWSTVKKSTLIYRCRLNGGTSGDGISKEIRSRKTRRCSRPPGTVKTMAVSPMFRYPGVPGEKQRKHF